MSFWHKLFDLDPFRVLPKASNAIRGLVGLPTDKEKKQQQKLMNEQIASYKEQTELAKQEMNTAKDAQTAEKRRIQEKQIRAVRRQSSSRGFLGMSDSSESGMSNQLGA